MNNPFETIDSRLSNIENLLLDLKHNPNNTSNQTDQNELLTVQDAAKFLTLSVPTIYGLIQRKELPVMKRSKRCYFSKDDLLSYVKAGRKQTVSEIESEVGNKLSRKKA